MTTAPANLVKVGAFWRAQGGVNLGIVGDTRHALGGTSYHLGADQLRSGAYSTRTARDQAGLSNYASAIDLGKLHGGFPDLRAFSTWLVDQCRHNAPDTRDIREVIWSPDGTTVLRWDRERGIPSEPRDGEADDSHRTHTHISWYRDSRDRDQTGPFRRYPAFASEDTVDSYSVPARPSLVNIPKGTSLFTTSDLHTVFKVIDPARPMPYIGAPVKGVRQVQYTDEDGKASGRCYYARVGDIGVPYPIPTPDCTAAALAAVAKVKKAIRAAVDAA